MSSQLIARVFDISRYRVSLVPRTAAWKGSAPHELLHAERDAGVHPRPAEGCPDSIPPAEASPRRPRAAVESPAGRAPRSACLAQGFRVARRETDSGARHELAQEAEERGQAFPGDVQ